MTDKQSKRPISRRKFLKASTLVVVGSAIAYGAVSVPLLRKDRVLLRPPGALDEDIFLASCIKCGQCLQVCPPQVIKLAGITGPRAFTGKRCRNGSGRDQRSRYLSFSPGR
ncbi:MAG: 4Fe-4S binding protein [Deltaproteobacteria bacterium]|nr:4Fe-4S binding protein [Deltaproteobacteria bacterium]